MRCWPYPTPATSLIRQYTLSEVDLSLIGQRRGDANRLGMAVQLSLLRFPGQGLLPDAIVPATLLRWIGVSWASTQRAGQYAEREETRREHLLELCAYMGCGPFGLSHYRQALHAATDLALQTDKGVVLAGSVLDGLRQRHIIIPTLDVIERLCAEAITRANRRIHAALTEMLTDEHRTRLGDLLKRREGSSWSPSSTSSPAWPPPPNCPTPSSPSRA